MTVTGLTVLLVCIAIWVYLLPFFIARMRRHPQSWAIFALNLFLGWTLIGWVGSLVWAFINSGNPSNQPVVIYMAPTADGTMKPQQMVMPPPPPKFKPQTSPESKAFRVLLAGGLVAFFLYALMHGRG